MSREHITEGPECWCEPRVEQACPECMGEGGDCWRCGGAAWVPLYDDTLPYHVVHNDTPRCTICGKEKPPPPPGPPDSPGPWYCVSCSHLKPRKMFG